MKTEKGISYIISGKEMKSFDQATMQKHQVPELVLMEQAATGFVSKFLDLGIAGRGIVFCGSGNNGADGIAIARLLLQKGIPVCVCMIKEIWNLKDKTTPTFDLQKEIYDSYGYPRITSLEELPTMKVDFVIDALFGVGLSREIEGAYREAVNIINGMDALRIGVDMPSGVSADNGQILGCAVSCDHTITFAYDKLGLRLWPGNEAAGEVSVVPIGIFAEGEETNLPRTCKLSDKALDLLPKRKAHSNKGTYGKLLLVAGGTHMAGAAILSAKAAYRSGVGLVRILTGEHNAMAIQSAVPEAIVSSYTEEMPREMLLEKVKEAIAWSDGIVIGPGLGQEQSAQDLLWMILQQEEHPMVIDADALNLLARHPEWLDAVRVPYAITPHLGEFSRISGKSIAQISEELVDLALSFAREHNCVCVLKDFRTITAESDGKAVLNLSGNHGMATAGSGDVLSGVIGALMVRLPDLFWACAYGVYIHGRAGDHAKEKVSATALMASDIIDGLKEVWLKVEK